jgi:hypothetical protein
MLDYVGYIYLLEQAGVKIEAANTVVLGRSNIVGMPTSLLVISQNATESGSDERVICVRNLIRGNLSCGRRTWSAYRNLLLMPKVRLDGFYNGL